jgi:uncharacterized membrane protein YeaQ/YmgE (transglycosylase-associated protein family)
MTVGEFLLFLCVAGLAGAVAQALAGYSRGGCLVAIALGFIGALLGQKLARVLQMPEPVSIHIGSESFPLVWSIIGATLAVVALNLLTRRGPRRWW